MQHDPYTGGDSKSADDIFPPRHPALVAITHIGAPKDQSDGGNRQPNGERWDNEWMRREAIAEHALTKTGRTPCGVTTDATDRKQCPITRGVLDYFPDALAEVARLSKVGNDQHNPGQPMHWDRSKSSDHADCIVRHLIQRGTRDTDGMLHSAKVAWRALAMLQLEIETLRKATSLVHYTGDEPTGDTV